MVTISKSGFHWSAFGNQQGSIFTETSRNGLIHHIGCLITLVSANFSGPNRRIGQGFNKRKSALRKFNKNPSRENHMHSKLARAKARGTIKDAKRSSWRQYVNKLNSRIPVKKVKLVPLLSTPRGTTGKDYCYDGCHWITY